MNIAHEFRKLGVIHLSLTGVTPQATVTVTGDGDLFALIVTVGSSTVTRAGITADEVLSEVARYM